MYKHLKKKLFFYLGKKWQFYVIFTSFSSKRGKKGVLFMLKTEFKKRKAFVQEFYELKHIIIGQFFTNFFPAMYFLTLFNTLLKNEKGQKMQIWAKITQISEKLKKSKKKIIFIRGKPNIKNVDVSILESQTQISRKKSKFVRGGGGNPGFSPPLPFSNRDFSHQILKRLRTIFKNLDGGAIF